jgi:hypothetical protein
MSKEMTMAAEDPSKQPAGPSPTDPRLSPSDKWANKGHV